MENVLKSIAINSNFEIEEKKSKFLAWTFYVENETQVSNQLKIFKKKYADAKHICYGYSLFEGKISKCSDNGEPAGSAGIPILQSILKQNLVNVLVIVVRYFGGIKLGKSRLGSIYLDVSLNSLKSSEIVDFCLGKQFNINTNYVNVNKIEKVVESFDAKIVKKTFLDFIQLLICVNEKDFNDLKNVLKDNFECEIRNIENVYLRGKNGNYY